VSLPAPTKSVLRYARRVLVGLDQFGNCLTGGAPGETISYRAAKLQAKNVIIGCVLCRFLDSFQKDHCAITLAADDKARTLGIAAASTTPKA
jgi:hypothetical protein